MIECLIKEDSISVAEHASDLMPCGIPDFPQIRRLPTISQHISIINKRSPGEGRKSLRKAIWLLFTNYCNSQTLPEGKKPNEDQQIEIASFLLDECDNFRLEDYLLMFTMAKRNKLAYGPSESKGRVFDRIDIQLISEFKDRYSELRQEGAYAAQQKEMEDRERYLPPDPRDRPEQSDEEKKANFDKGFGMLLEMIDKNQKEADRIKREETQRRQQETLEMFQQLQTESGSDKPLFNLEEFKRQTK